MPYEVHIYVPDNIAASLVFDPLTIDFHACLECLMTNEVRFCDGTTLSSWTMCPIHEAPEISGDTTSSNDEILNFLRNDIYRGIIKKPKFRKTSRPTPGTQLGVGFARTTLGRDYLIKSRDMFQNTHGLWPAVRSNYSHAEGCVHGTDVDFKIVRNGELISCNHFNRDHEAKEALKIEQRTLLAMAAMDNWGVVADVSHESCRENKNEELFFKRCNGQYVSASGRVAPSLTKDLPQDLAESRETVIIDDLPENQNIDLVEEGEAQPQPSIQDSTDIFTSCNIIPTAEASTLSDKASPPVLQTLNHTKTTTTVVQPKIPLQVLMAREQLVHTGAVDAIDLIATCWTWNNFEARP